MMDNKFWRWVSLGTRNRGFRCQYKYICVLEYICLLPIYICACVYQHWIHCPVEGGIDYPMGELTRPAGT
jgi:hypothetical protein